MLVIGLMSGTSADGVDAAICEIDGEPGTHRARIIAGRTYSYDSQTRARILNGCDPASSDVAQIAALNVELGEHFAAAALALISESGASPHEIDLIGAHGQTLWHAVLPDGRVSATFQIGEAAIIAERTGITTINNFRARDVAAGGQGAPLTAYADWLLLRHETRWRAIQNIGGIGNVTFLPPLNDDTNAPVTFDTGPGNAMIDLIVAHYTGGESTYDHDGECALNGRVDADWLADLLRHPYFARPIPKTTGRELFGAEMARRLVADGEARGLAADDIIATVTALTSASIADSYQRFAPAHIDEVIVGGGGCHNPVIMDDLRGRLAPAPMRTHEAVGMNSDFKEALVFALLAYETWHGRAGTLPSLTGASHNSVLGQITPGDNYESLLRSRLNLTKRTT